jgi:hypothetical protein
MKKFLTTDVPLINLQNKNTNNAKSEVRFKQLIRGAFIIDSSTPTLRINLNEHSVLKKYFLFKLS